MFTDTISVCGEQKHLMFLHVAPLFFHDSVECGGKCACPLSHQSKNTTAKKKKTLLKDPLPVSCVGHGQSLLGA